MVPVEIVIEDTGTVRIIGILILDLPISDSGHVRVVHPRKAFPSLFARTALRSRDRIRIGHRYDFELGCLLPFLISCSPVDSKVTWYRRYYRCTFSPGLWHADDSEICSTTG
jgi:hypothetical protein